MISQYVTTIIGGAGFAAAAIMSHAHLKQRAAWARPALFAGALLALAVDLGHFVYSVRAEGMVDTFHHNFEATLLLALLIGLIGLCAHVSAKLRGLDGFLFLFATVVQLAALTVIYDSRNNYSRMPWFISHPLAFALSATCFFAAGAAGLAYLMVNALLRRKRMSPLVGNVASLESLERFGRWMLITGFPLFTYGILTGICGIWHQNPTPGRTRWLTDPTVVSAAITWLVYAYVLWSFLFRPQIRGRRAATLAAAGMGMVAIVFLVIEFVSPLHR